MNKGIYFKKKVLLQSRSNFSPSEMPLYIKSMCMYMKGFLCEANHIQSEIWAEKIDLFKAKRGFKKVGIFFLP